ncbi:MAG TPA: hypothetical protein P5049_06025, partial [Methanothrix sp.]|nr:hypothetical protein [Methanothrix sp.]
MMDRGRPALAAGRGAGCREGMEARAPWIFAEMMTTGGGRQRPARRTARSGGPAAPRPPTPPRRHHAVTTPPPTPPAPRISGRESDMSR